jgi:pimeloyl-ACP methyl ester carboxylesterase
MRGALYASAQITGYRAMTPEFLHREDAPGPRKLAFLRQPGSGAAVVWLGGFRSDMRATKAEALSAWAGETGRAFLRFDYSGHGESGGRFEDCTISTWTADADAMIAAHGGERPLLVGSSMGGWIALLAACALAEAGRPVGGLVLIAPAVDFTQELMWDQFPQGIRDEIMRDGRWLRPSAYSPEPYPITRALIEDGRRHALFGRPIMPGCPVAILQGMEDPDVPWGHAMKLAEHLPASDVTLTMVKDGDHRLSRPQDIRLLTETVARMAALTGAEFGRSQ